jgi:sugar-specific transcriptional regulator TrmB
MRFPVEEKDFQTLTELGLTISQIKIYLTLLKLSTPSKAFNIHQSSGFPRQDVYRVLQELLEMGIVERIISKPNKFCAIELQNATQSLLEKKIVQYNELVLKTKDLVQRAKNLKLEKLHEDKMFLIIEKYAIIDKIKKSIENTQSSIDIIFPKRENHASLSFVGDSLRIAKNKNVTIRIITEKTHNPKSALLLNMFKEGVFDLKYVSKPPETKFGIYDNNIILALFEEGNFGEAPAICTNSPSIIALAKNYFEKCWKNGKQKIN